MRLFYRLIMIAGLWLSCCTLTGADIRLTERCQIHFATREQGVAAITVEDRFTRSLSPFDLQARMRTDREVTLADWKEFVAGEVREWNEVDRGRVAAAIDSLRDRFAKLSVPLPDEVQLVLTTGNEEAGAAYCRGKYIVLPATALQRDRSQIESLLIHELFHIISSQHPELRQELYAIVGFEQCSEIRLHSSLEKRRITNPDAPAIDCIISLKDGNRVFRAAPVLYGASERFDPKKPGGLFAQLVFRLMVVVPDGRHWKPADNEGRAVVIDPKGSPDFQEKIGRNTNYIIHPEEILADNFVHLVLEREDVPTPRIVNELRRVLEGR